jgi:hypothetical protein
VVTFSVVVVFVCKLAEVQLADVLQIVMPFLTEQVVILQSTFGVAFSSLFFSVDFADVTLLVEFAAVTASVMLVFSIC